MASLFCIQGPLEGRETGKHFKFQLIRVYGPLFLSCLQHWPKVLSPVRRHCVCVMCVLAQTEHFHQASVVVESKMKKQAEGRTRIAQVDGDVEFNTSLPVKIEFLHRKTSVKVK